MNDFEIKQGDPYISKEYAIQCALICFDEILKARTVSHSDKLKKFLKGFILEFFNNKDFDVAKDFTTQNHDFLENCSNVIENQSLHIGITQDTFLVVEYDAHCDFEYNSEDETSVNLGGSGEICGVSSSAIVMTKITLFCGDGQFFNFTGDKEIRSFLFNNLEIL